MSDQRKSKQLKKYIIDRNNSMLEFLLLLPTAIIVLFMAIGLALWKFGTLEALFQEGFFSIAVFFLIAISLITLFYLFKIFAKKCDLIGINRSLFSVSSNRRIMMYAEKKYEKYPYIGIFFLFSVFYLPYLVLSYPTLLWGDAPAQILQGYNLPNKTMTWLKMMNENVYLNQHHSVPHTMLIHLCIVIGKFLFGSYNVGLFIYSLIQFYFIVFCFAYSIHYLYKNGVPKLFVYLTLIYCLIAPRLHTHILLVTKDIIYGGFLLLFSISVFDTLISGKKLVTKKSILMFFISTFGLFLFRNEGVIIGVVVLFFASIFSSSRRKMIISVLAICLTIVLTLSKVIYPAFDISPGSIREVLCVPLQQTSLYLNRHLEEVTPQEKEAISEIVDFEYIRVNYHWDRADSAKEMYNNDATKEQLKNYFVVWWQMFLKHPLTYFDATLHQTYRYFFPIGGRAYGATYEDSASLMQYTNDNSGEYHMNFHYPCALTKARNIYEKGTEFLARYTPLAIFSYSATYLWSLVIMFFYFLSRKRRCSVIVLIASVLQYAACFAGPLDGTCFRYIYPMAITLPFVFVLGIFADEGDKNNS